MRARGRAASLVVVVLAVVLAGTACSESLDSPREALSALRAAAADQDGTRLFALQDSESRGMHLDQVRTLRARVERGDDLRAMLAGLELTADDVRGAADEQLAAQFMVTQSIVAHDADFLAGAELVEETPEGPDTALLTLQGANDRTMRLWFVRENGAWLLDAHRSMR